MRDATLHYSANQISSFGARITFSRSLLLRMQVHSGEVDNIENAVDQIVNWSARKGTPQRVRAGSLIDEILIKFVI